MLENQFLERSGGKIKKQVKKVFILKTNLKKQMLSKMKVHLVKEQTIRDFMKANPQSRAPFEAWLRLVRVADWSEPGDMSRTFSAADLLGRGSNRVIFDIGGNNYRMICSYAFGKKNVHLFVKWIGSHAAYDALCARGLQYTIDDF